MHQRNRSNPNSDQRAVSMLPTLVMMARRPEPGRVKTRLCPPLTATQAASLYELFLRDLVAMMRTVSNTRSLIAYAPTDAAEYFAALAPDIARRPQVGRNLGERLAAITTELLAEGTSAVVIIGSDSPSLPPTLIGQALAELERGVDLVLGPADDGGYYLVGLRRIAPSLFTEVLMSTSTVLRDTLAVAERLGLRTVLIDPWYDIDTIADLQRLHADPAPLPHSRPLLETLLRNLYPNRP
ncbi:TIGR04282 family arsenosugar biosynthesis glycosyltransferase [Chloroflexus sp.]